MPAAIPTITVGSGIGAVVFMLTTNSASRLLGLEAFFALWAVQFTIWGFWYMFIYPFFVSPLRKLPTPPGWPLIVGHGWEAVSRGFGVMAREWITTTPNDGFIRFLALFHREYLVVTSPQALGEILVTKAYDFEKPRFLRDFFGPVLGHGLVLAEGNEHKLHRRNLMPAFAFRHIKDLYPLFWQKACEVVQVMTETCGAAPGGVAELDVDHWAGRVSLDIIGVAGLGHDFGAILNERDEVVETYMIIATPSATDRTMMIIADFASAFVPVWMLHYVPVPRALQAQKAARVIRGVCQDVIRAKKRELADGKLETVDILSVALRSGVFGEEELVNHLMTFLGAGHETTASALSFGIYAMCRYPEVQTRLRDEIRANLPSVSAGGQGITSVDIDRLPYLAAVCSEVLRVYSPVPQTVREAVRDTCIQGQALPKGTRMILAAWGTNLDANHWGPDAGEFKPERWLVKGAEDGLGGVAENAKMAAVGGASSNYALLSFLHGPRSCIGQSFARAEFACLLAAWVGRFEFELCDKRMMDESNIVFEQLITVKATGGIHVRAKVVPGY